MNETRAHTDLGAVPTHAAIVLAPKRPSSKLLPTVMTVHIQACAAWARHDCFGSRGCSSRAIATPRLRQRADRGRLPARRSSANSAALAGRSVRRGSANDGPLSSWTTRSSLARAALRFEAAAAIEYARRTPLLTAAGSVGKHGPLSLSRPSGHAPRRRAHCSVGRAARASRSAVGAPASPDETGSVLRLVQLARRYFCSAGPTGQRSDLRAELLSFVRSMSRLDLEAHCCFSDPSRVAA